MGSGMYSALSGALAQRNTLRVTMNNLANVGDAGYKTNKNIFESYLSASDQIERSKGINYVNVSDKATDFSQGKLKETSRFLDFGIQGQGFFKVAGDEGFLYTRKGNFHLDQNSNLVTLDGYQVVGENGPINLPTDNVEVDSQGRIWGQDNNQLGTLTVYDFNNLKNIQRDGYGYWTKKDEAEETIQDSSSISQGVLEEANFSPLLVTKDLISLQRSFGALIKTLQSYGEVSKQANEIGKIS